MDEAKQLPALKPCPFCGGAPSHDATRGVWCNNDACAIVGQVFSGGARHWNARALAAHQPSAAEPVAPNAKAIWGEAIDICETEMERLDSAGDPAQSAGAWHCVEALKAHPAALPAAAAPPVAVPVGYALVPIEPTPEMQTAGAQAIRFDTTVLNKIWTGNAVFRAMVAAVAPAAARVDVEGV